MIFHKRSLTAFVAMAGMTGIRFVIAQKATGMTGDDCHSKPLTVMRRCMNTMILTNAAYMLALAAGFVGVYLWKNTIAAYVLKSCKKSYEQEKISEQLREKLNGDTVLALE
jgi:hypothetical protein